MCNNIIYSI